MSLRRVAGLCLVASIIATGTGVAQAEPSPPPAPGSLTVTGDVQRTLTLSMADLRAMPARTEDVTFTTEHGSERHQYTGPSVDAVLDGAQPNGGGPEHHPLLTVAVDATAVDGYSAVLSWGDITPALTARPPLVAWSEDGRPLDRARLVVPDDVGGARYVKDLVELRVTQLAAVGR